MEGRTAILIGAVASERDRRMSQLLVQLEPGVAKVENRIVVVK
jgi:osmotically-inducible protein OsmY